MPEYRYRFGERFFEVNLERLANGDQRATIREGETFTTFDFSAEQTVDSWHLNLPDGQYRAVISSSGDMREIWLKGATYSLKREAERTSRATTPDKASGQIEAQMPGLVREVLVQAGDHVERGQTLVILEAMKMELRMPAPFDGVVKQMHIRKGEIAARGQLLVEIV